MLKNNFFKILEIKETGGNELIAGIKLNTEHQIFDGHFPGNPVVPGVVSIQMINEILSERLGKKLMLTKARNIKFPAMINPNINPELHFQIKYSKQEEETYKINAQIYFEDTVFLKFNGIFDATESLA